jgi:hypothetical protein
VRSGRFVTSATSHVMHGIFPDLHGEPDHRLTGLRTATPSWLDR